MTIAQKLARTLKTPRQVQRYLRTLPYNREHNGQSLASAQTALKRKRMHCLEATFAAAAILEHHGYPPLVMSFESVDLLDHVIYVFQDKKTRKWGAIARSRDEGLHGRAPVYRTPRDLAKSYIDPYVDKSGRIKAFQIANLDDMGTNWRTSTRNVWKVENHLREIRHHRLKTPEARYKKLLRAYHARGPMPMQRHWW